MFSAELFDYHLVLLCAVAGEVEHFYLPEGNTEGKLNIQIKQRGD